MDARQALAEPAEEFVPEPDWFEDPGLAEDWGISRRRPTKMTWVCRRKTWRRGAPGRRPAATRTRR